MKIEEQVLSREQMAHLVELGLDRSDASMAYYNISREDEPDKWLLGIANNTIATAMLVNGFEEMQPAYTIGDLIEKLPKEIDGRKIIIDFKRGAIGYLDFQILLLQDFELGTILTRMYHLLCWVAEKHKEIIK